MHKIIILTFLLLASPIHGGQLDYKCETKAVYHVDDNGRLKPIISNDIESVLIGKSFTIDRTNGAVVGEPFTNSDASKIQIINKGDGVGSAFKLLSVWDDMDNRQMFIHIKEQFTSTANRFVGIPDGGGIYTGLCK